LEPGQAASMVEAEVESSEDDIHQNISAPCNGLAQKFLLEEFAYTTFLKSRYLRLASTLQRQCEIPYFVLYHSWKSYLI
jgi:hypothetical protein